MAPASLEKYLNKYAEPECFSLARINQRYHHTLIIPCYNESPHFEEKVSQMLTQYAELLLIIVINAPPQPHALRHSHSNNQQLHSALLDLGRLQFQQDNIQWLQCPNNNGIVLIDRYSKHQEIPKNQGVGLARKIAADCAAALIANDTIAFPWIYSTDADANLPADYFTKTQQTLAQNTSNSQPVSAALLPFTHQRQINLNHRTTTDRHPQLLSKQLFSKQSLAAQLYEFSLHYYVAGLVWSESPYGFHSIGSTLVINTEAYGKVRGFPKRSGAEDFYILNKLAKVGGILSLESPTITLSCRASQRAPFGTGRAINEISAMNSPMDDYVFYNPETFLYLKYWLQQVIPKLWNWRHVAAKDALTQSIELIQFPQQTLNHGHLIQGLEQQNIGKAIQHGFQQCPSEAQFIHHIHTYFDAFKTLKLIHWLRDNGHHSCNFSQLYRCLQTPLYTSLSNQLFDSPPPNLEPAQILQQSIDKFAHRIATTGP